MFSVFRERLGPVEGPQLGLEQGPVRKAPPLLIETTQFSLSVTPFPLSFPRAEERDSSKALMFLGKMLRWNKVNYVNRHVGKSCLFTSDFVAISP